MVKEKVEALSSFFFIREYVPETPKIFTPDLILSDIKLLSPLTVTWDNPS